MKYRKKPVEIEAIQLRWSTWNEVCEFVGPETINPNSPAWSIPAEEASATCGEPGPNYIAIEVTTTHGEKAIVRHGDWIIPDSKPHTFYPCKPDVFEQTYEPVEDAAGQTETVDLVAALRDSVEAAKEYRKAAGR